jgi:hypothetical protein
MSSKNKKRERKELFALRTKTKMNKRKKLEQTKISEGMCRKPNECTYMPFNQ